MSIRGESVEQYNQLEHENGQLRDFERYIKEHGPCTRAMAGKALNYPANVYSARIKRLIDEEVVCELTEKAPCEETGVRVNWVVHRDRVTLSQLGVDPCDDCRRESSIFSFTKICCAARYVLFSGGAMGLTEEVMSRKYGHDLTKLKLVKNAMLRVRRRKMVEASVAANEGQRP